MTANRRKGRTVHLSYIYEVMMVRFMRAARKMALRRLVGFELKDIKYAFGKPPETNPPIVEKLVDGVLRSELDRQLVANIRGFEEGTFYLCFDILGVFYLDYDIAFITGYYSGVTAETVSDRCDLEPTPGIKTTVFIWLGSSDKQAEAYSHEYDLHEGKICKHVYNHIRSASVDREKVIRAMKELMVKFRRFLDEVEKYLREYFPEMR